MAGGKLKYPFTWREPTAEEKAERKELWGHPLSSCADDVIIAEPGGLVFPKGFKEIAEEIYNMEVRPDDVWVVTYPKCGTTWTQEMVWQIGHNFDTEKGKVDLNVRFPFMEMQMFVDQEKIKKFPDLEILLKQKSTMKAAMEQSSPRYIKSHLPLPMLPPNLLDTAKVIFVARNPKDCCVSYYNHEKLIPVQGYTGDFAQFAKMFKEGKNAYGDYWIHLEHAWKNRNHPNARFFWFEDMKKDLIPVIKNISAFLGKHLTELKVLHLDDHLYFDNFKKNPAVNNEAIDVKETGQSFIRKGKVGDWKNFFTPEITKEWGQWIAIKQFKHGIDYKFTAM